MSNCTPAAPVKNELVSSGEYIILAQQPAVTNTVIVNNQSVSKNVLTPYKNVLKFTGIKENIIDAGTGTIIKKDFRYSLDGETYSEFQELNVSSIEALGSFSEVYFQFRYILLSGGPVTIIWVQLEYITTNNAYEEVPANITDDSKIYAYPIAYKSNFLWEPYKMNKAIRLYKDLNLMVNSLFGHDVHYYRALPQGRSRDVFLMEYSLFEHDKHQCMKVVVPNNEFPDNKLNMGPFGQDFEMPFEVQVDKDYFQRVFGEGSGPQKRDVIFFPRTGRIYEISSSYLFRDFMNEPLYFKVTLIKWLPKSNVDQSEDVNTLESFTVSTTALFGEEIAQQQVDITNEQQFKISTTFEDPIRSKLEMFQEINDIKLLNYYTLISEHFYKMDSMLNLPLIKLTIPDVEFIKDSIYYVRNDFSVTQTDEQYYMSMKKLTYIGQDLESNNIFSYSNGNSVLQRDFNISKLFGPTSSFKVYDTEYTGSTGATANVSLADCTMTPTSYRSHVVEYKAQNDFNATVDRSYSAWFRLKTNSSLEYNVVSFSFDMYNKYITININRPIDTLIGDMLTLKQTTTTSFLVFGRVVEIISPTSIKIEVDQEILDFIKISTPTWESFTLTMQKSYSRVFLNSMINDKGLKIELFENRHIKITSNNTYAYYSFASNYDGLAVDTWYGLFINFSNIFRQITVNVWKMEWNSSTNLPATTNLTLILNKMQNMMPLDRTSCTGYFLEPSLMDLTNVRLFNRVVETEKQMLVLNQNIVKDAHNALIIDNAIPQSHLPYVGYTR